MQEENKSSSMRKIIERLKSAGDGGMDFASDGAHAFGDTIHDTFNAENVARAVLPPIVGEGVARWIAARRDRKEQTQSKSKGDKKKQSANPNPSDVSEYNLSNPSSNDDTDYDEDDGDQDDLELLAEIMEEGFDETNESLHQILKSLEKDYEIGESDEAKQLALIDINGKTLSVLERIEENSREDELQKKADRLKEDRTKKKDGFKNVLNSATGKTKAGNTIADSIKDGIVSRVMGAVGSALGAVLGVKALGMGGAKVGIAGKIGSALVGAKGLAGRAVGGIASAGRGIASAGKGIGGVIGRTAIGRVAGLAGMAGTAIAGIGGSTPSAVNAPSNVVQFPNRPSPSVTGNTTAISPSRISNVTPISNSVSNSTGASNVTPISNSVSNSTGASNVTPISNSVSNSTGASNGWSKSISSVKGFASKMLGAPLVLAGSALQASSVHGNADLSEPEKNQEYSKIAGGAGGTLLGAKVGAALGALTGPIAPIAVPLLAILGGAMGYFGGEKVGSSVGGQLFNNSEETSIRNRLQTAIGSTSISSATNLSYSDMVQPTMRSLDSGDLTANDSKYERLNSITHQIDALNAEKQDVVNTNNIIPIQVNNNTNNQTSESGETRHIAIPSVRNQDGTIQRMLDANFSTMLK